MLYHLRLRRAPYDRVAQAGLSADYVEREKRAGRWSAELAAGPGTGGTAGAGAGGRKVDVWPGIDIDVPVGGGSSHCTPASVKAAVAGAFKGGATGVILSRNYAEMKPENLSGAGAALDELGLR